MKLLERESVSAHFMEAFVAMHRRLAAYMAKDRTLIATMASQMSHSGQHPTNTVYDARELLNIIDGDA